jgi:hypothetical protein
VKRIVSWMFFCSDRTRHEANLIWWWEVRRIPFNLLIGLWGALCMLAFMWGVGAVLAPGEDAVEPVALLAAPVVINALYTLGWLLEIPVRWLWPQTSLRFGPVLWGLGLGTGMILCVLPAAFWVGYRLLH